MGRIDAAIQPRIDGFCSLDNSGPYGLAEFTQFLDHTPAQVAAIAFDIVLGDDRKRIDMRLDGAPGGFFRVFCPL
jgi:hypothetical protein